MGLSKKVCVFAGTDRLQPIYQSEGCEIFNNDCYIWGTVCIQQARLLNRMETQTKGCQTKIEPHSSHHSCQTKENHAMIIMAVKQKGSPQFSSWL